MKILFSLLLLITSNAFGIDFNKVSGSFDEPIEKKSEQLAQASVNAEEYEKSGSDFKGRTPSSFEATAQIQGNSKK